MVGTSNQSDPGMAIPYSSKHLLRLYLELIFGVLAPSQRVFGAIIQYMGLSENVGYIPNDS